MTNLDYLYNPDAVKDKFDRNYFVDKKLGFSVIERGTVLPHKVNPGKFNWGKGGIVDSKNNYIKDSFVNNAAGAAYTPTEEIQYNPSTVIYLGLFYPVWGHVILDDIRRVWFLKSDTFRREFKNCPLIYIPWTGSNLERQKNFRRLLEILEVDVDRLQPITQPTQFDKIILPDESIFMFDSRGIRNFTAEYRETIDRVRHFALKHRTPTPFRKIYYYYGRKQFGEERIAKYFMSKGYAVVQPEFLTTDEQLNLLINADVFASTVGSCAHNSIFLRDNAETVYIPRYANAVLVQPIIDQVHPVNATYIDSSFSVFNVRHDLFCFVISEQLKRFFGDHFDGYIDADFQTFLQYFKFAVGNGRDFNLKEVQGYGSALEDFLTQLKAREDFNRLLLPQT